MKKKKKRSLVGWMGNDWHKYLRVPLSIHEETPKEIRITRYKTDASDKKIRQTIEEI